MSGAAAPAAARGRDGPLRLGLHTGLRDDADRADAFGALRRLWVAAEDAGYDAVSVWDHFDAGARPGGGPCFEAVSLHTALAMATRRVRCGAFVYAAAHRPPAVLAKAIATIDHVSGGRAEVGLGAGWSQVEHDAHGIPWGGPGERLDRLEDALAVVTHMLGRDPVPAAGDPPPVQDRVPVWVGGTGERRTLGIVARWADGWNCGYVAPDEFSRLLGVLHEHCEAQGRPPAELDVSVNLVAAADDAGLARSFRGVVDRVGPSALLGSRDRMAQTLGAYVAAGARRVNAVVRAPGDAALVEGVADAVRSL